MDSVLGVVRGLVLTVLAFGLIVFFHELGHFIAAKLIGVRVEKFSFGMGPRLIGRQWGQTEYMICAVPIGGYVKMAGGDEGEDAKGAPDEFVSKSPGQRAFVFVAGPAFSILLGVPMLMGMYIAGQEMPTARVSDVVLGSPAWDAGVKYGDRIRRLGEEPIETFNDLQLASICMAHDTASTMLVERGAKDVALTITRPRGSRLGISCGFHITRIDRTMPDSPAAAVGLRRGDEFTTVDGKGVRGWLDFRRRILPNPGHELSIGIRRDGKAMTAKVKPAVITRPDPGFGIRLPREVGFVRKGFPAEGKIEVGDHIVQVNAQPVKGWWDVEDAVADGPAKVTLMVRRGDGTTTVELERGEGMRAADTLGIAPRPTYIVDAVHGASDPPLEAGDELVKAGGRDVAKGIIDGMLYQPLDDVLGVLADAGTLTMRRGDTEFQVKLMPGERVLGQIGVEQTVSMVVRKKTVAGSFVPALEKTGEAAMLVYVILRKMLDRDVKASSVAGPIGILQITYMSATRGWSDLFYLVGMITVNIGVLNLLPLPPLDGGRLVLVAYEKVRGRQPSRKFQEVVILAGVGLLVVVFVLATFNDVSRLFQ